ncbi:unnamed protein product [Clavelina lepadiformis]|uniref:MANSC domain-containing protein n=1 Tax=Clavelina lepadiformis TaxID=159417 RepID=A0ABP0FMT7_CLALP
MYQRNVQFCFLSLVLLSFSQIIEANEALPENVDSENSTSLESCQMLETRVFKLDLGCVHGPKARSTAHELTTETLEDCKRVCCEWKEGPCDFVYWDSYHKCIVMNYYVLGLCMPTVSSSSSSSHTLLLSISDRVIPGVRKPLLKQYRKQVQGLLGCSDHQYVCDNWNCIDNKYMCDGIPHCSDGSDELYCASNDTGLKCINHNGDHVDAGKQYRPYNEPDECKTCVCGEDSKPIYCYLAVCQPLPPSACNGPRPELCCQCNHGNNFSHDQSDPNDTNSSYVRLNNTQRLIVSCMSVLIIVMILLFFSRNIVHRRRHGGMHQNYLVQPSSRENGTWMRANGPEASNNNRSFFSRYWSNSDTVSFFDQDEPPVPCVDPPPPYTFWKPNTSSTNNEVSLENGQDPPPSYPTSSTSGSRQSINEGAGPVDGPPCASPTMHQSDDTVAPQPIRRGDSEDEPASPSSTTSESLLIANEQSTSRPERT